MKRVVKQEKFKKKKKGGITQRGQYRGGGSSRSCTWRQAVMVGWERTVIKGPANQWKMCRAAWIPTDFCLGIFVGCPSCLELWMQSFPARCEAGGHRPSSSAPWALLRAHFWAKGLYPWLWVHSFSPLPWLLPGLPLPAATLCSCSAPLTLSDTCYHFLSFHWALILTLNLPSLWKGWRETSLEV